MARLWYYANMEVTSYFVRQVLENPDREGLTKEVCEQVVEGGYVERIQQPCGRWRYHGRPEGFTHYLRVIVTEDGTGLFNAFFDTRYTRDQQRRESEG